MDWIRILLSRCAAFLHPQKLDADLEEELRAHIELAVEENRMRGLPEEEARTAALRSFGGVTQTRERYRSERGLSFLESLVGDLRYAARQLRKHPGFTVTALLTLGLGIGANAAIFTLIHATLLQNLPVPHPEQLVRVGDGDRNGISWFSTQMYDQLRKNTPEFQELAAMQASSPDNSWLTLHRQGVDELPHGEVSEWVSGNYFAMMGIAPAAGRLLQPADDIAGAPMVAVMSDAMWQREYAGDPTIVGSVFVINTYPVTIVGIAPKHFFGDRITAYPTDLFVPLATEPLLGESDYTHHPEMQWLYILGRLKPGVALAPLQAKMHAELVPLLSQLLHFFDALGREERIKRMHLALTPGHSGIAVMPRDMVAGLHLLMWISGLVLLIACANIANLVLARGLARNGEISVRVALGAARSRIVRQMLTESVLLSCMGGVVGVAIAYLVSAMMLRLAFPHARFSPLRATPSPQVLGFAFAVSLLTGLLFGMAPAWATSHAQPAHALRRSNRTSSGHASLLQRSLVVLQAGLSVILLIGAGLLTRSLMNLQHQNFGIEVEHRVVVRLNAQNAGYTIDQLQPLYDRMRARMLSLPGVRKVGMALFAPLDGDDWDSDVVVEGQPQPGPNEDVRSSWDRISPDLFDALGQRLVRGRNLLVTDTPQSPGVAVVNRAFVKRFFPRGEDPIGQHFGMGDRKSAADWQIVGVVENAKYQYPNEEQQPMFFLPLLQRAKSGPKSSDVSSLYIGSIILVTTGPIPGLEHQVRQALEEINPNLNVNNYETLEAQIGDRLNQEKLVARLTLLFGLLALALAAVGLYGLTAYTVAQRGSEIGIRMALGAERGDIVRMVLQGAILQTGLGLLIGVPVALLCARYMQSQLFEVTREDPGVLVAAIAALALAACAAAILPAKRAATIDAAKALRSE
jgi:macrolide transport system ATP-binding/permease protein